MNAMFENWCLLHDRQSLPATPSDVAAFVSTIAPMEIEKVWPIVQEISRAHYMAGHADPTLGGPVAATVNDIAKIDPPQSWPKDHKFRFTQLPYDLQAYVAVREKERDITVRRAQTDTANARNELAAVRNELAAKRQRQQTRQRRKQHDGWIARRAYRPRVYGKDSSAP
jgi:hypothetical protein